MTNQRQLVSLERFWLPMGKSYALTSAGWLSDPGAGGLWRQNAEAVSTRSLADQRCVVLLGEPGMGKTSALAGGDALRPMGEAAVSRLVDLGVYGSEERLVRAVFENEQVRAWQSGGHRLCLTLDGFDEALNRIDTLGRLLVEYLASWDAERLFFRLVCRTADWPQTLRHALEARFGEANIHELLPLRRSDAGLLLGAAGLDADEVLTAVERARIVPLAARPLTLRLIESSIEPDGSLPGLARDLYERGLKALLDEMNPQRRGSVRPPGGVRLRMTAAERIAAQSLFCGRPTIWTGPVAEAKADDLTVDDCAWASREGAPRVSSDEVDAVLRSGVFTGASESRLTWSHATFADFLAAKWILDQSLDDEQVGSLLIANDGRIHARVRQVAAWLVGLAPTRFRHFIQLDPQAFLQSVDLAEDTLRAEIVRALLEEAQSGLLFDDYDVDYSGLQHSGLARQLRSILVTAQSEPCRVAIRIARQCSVGDSVPDLTALALNEVADPRLRASAAMAVHDLSDAAPSHDLVTLIGSQIGRVSEVEARELEAAALLASWPHAITTEAVFSVLSPVHPHNYYGLYSIFVDDFARKLQDADLQPACDWIRGDLSRVDDSRLTTLVNAILRLCVRCLEQECAREVVKEVALKRIDDYQPPFGTRDLHGDEIQLDTEQRRRVTRLLLAEASEEQVWRLVHRLSHDGDPLVHDEDLDWLLQLYATGDGKTRANAGRCAQELYKPELVSHSTVVLGLSGDHPAADLFSYWRSFIDLDSPEAVEVRDLWRERARKLKRMRIRESDPGDDWVNPRIAKDIAKAAAGDASAFWYPARLVTVRPGTRQYMDEYQPDLTRHPRWETLSDVVRSQFVDAAQIYVETGECRPEQWFGQDVVSYLAQAGYRALVLLLRLSPAALSDVSPAAWREWAPILIDWTPTINGASEQDKRMLLSLARRYADDELGSALLTLLDKAIVSGSHISLRVELDSLSSQSLAQRLVDRLASPMGAEPRRTILDFLVERYVAMVAPMMRTWLGQDQRIEDHDRAVDAAVRLLRHDAAGSWPELSALIRDDAPFMETTFLAAAHAYDRQAPNLEPQDLADLYLWLCERFPAADDPQFEDVHAVGARESLGYWRDALLSALSSAGTREAVAAIERIALARPEAGWLARTLVDAKRAQRDQSWEPLTVGELDSLALSRKTRVVRSDRDLLAAVLSALDEIQARLQADTPAAQLLWDTHARRPKAEEEISDYLAIELQQRLNDRGVVVNREVQVRRSKPSGLPERTDLRVEATASGPMNARSRTTIRIPGEVKGAWNVGLVDSLERQLVDRYMADFQTDCGVYVVAWFDQDSWTDADGRRSKAAARGGIANIRAALEVEVEKQRAQGRAVAVRVLDCSLRRPTATT